MAATHRDLAREVSAGRFREDLLYRLQVLVISLPPLRERPGDLPILAAHLLDRISCERGRPAPRLGREVLDLLERYPWPGNVRQLENALQRLALLAGDGPITRETIEADAGQRQMLLADALHAEPTFSLERNEREQIRRALEARARRAASTLLYTRPIPDATATRRRMNARMAAMPAWRLAERARLGRLPTRKAVSSG